MRGFPGGSVIKNPPANAGDVGLILGLERSLGGRNDSPLQYSCLENSMDRGAWQAQSMWMQRVRHILVTEQHGIKHLLYITHCVKKNNITGLFGWSFYIFMMPL